MAHSISLEKLHELDEGGIPNSYLTDGEHIIVVCSVCNKPLCDVWVTQPKLEVKTRLVAHCDYCGDRSFVIDVKGKFHLGRTNESSIIRTEQTFEDNECGGGVIYQKVDVFTQRDIINDN